MTEGQKKPGKIIPPPIFFATWQLRLVVLPARCRKLRMRTRIFVRWNSRVPIPRTDKAMSLDSSATVGGYDGGAEETWENNPPADFFRKLAVQISGASCALQEVAHAHPHFVRWNSGVPILRTDKAMSLDSTPPR